MYVIISSLLLLGFFIVIAISEKKSARREREFFKKASVQTADLRERATLRYRERFGKEPTMEVPALASNGENHWNKSRLHRK